MFLALFLCESLYVDNSNENRIVEEAIDQFALILIRLAEELHTPKEEDSESSDEDIIN